MRRFEKAKEFVQSDQFGNVIDFFQGVRGDSVSGQPVQRVPPPDPRVVQGLFKKPDYTPLYILGAIAVLVAIIKK